VTANVAEGIGRYHYLETIQSCRMARGSLYELLDHLQVAVDNNYLKAAEFKAFDERIRSASRLLNGFVRYLRDRKDGAGKSRSTDKPINR